MSDEHLNANRVWTLIRDGAQFTPKEAAHMRGCNHCIEWVANFAALARKSGFRITFEIPSLVQPGADPS